MVFLLSEFPVIGRAAVLFACEGSAVSWPALGCLRSIFRALRSKASPPFLFPSELLPQAPLQLQALQARSCCRLVQAC